MIRTQNQSVNQGKNEEMNRNYIRTHMFVEVVPGDWAVINGCKNKICILKCIYVSIFSVKIDYEKLCFTNSRKKTRQK